MKLTTSMGRARQRAPRASPITIPSYPDAGRVAGDGKTVPAAPKEGQS